MDDDLGEYILRKNHTILMQNLDPDEIVDILVEDSVLELDDAEEIEVLPTRRRKLQCLLSHIRKRQDGYTKLTDALKKSEQYPWILAAFEETDKTEYEEKQAKLKENMDFADKHRNMDHTFFSIVHVLDHNQDVQNSWLELGKKLKIPAYRLNGLKNRKSTLTECVYELLRDWKQLAGLEGNLYTLCNALKELGFKDAIDDVIKFAKSGMQDSVHLTPGFRQGGAHR